MNKLAKLAMWSLGALLVLASPVFAQDGGQALIEFSGAFGAGLVTMVPRLVSVNWPLVHSKAWLASQKKRVRFRQQ